MNKKKYSNAQILQRVREHCVKNMLSIHSMSDPCYNTIKARCATDKGLEVKFQSLMRESWAVWEKVGIDTIMSGNSKDFNTPLYKALTLNKRPFLPIETLELEDRITALEERANEPQN